MADATILAAVKLALRVTTTAYDSEIADLIDTALLDIETAGITKNDTSDPLIRTAIITYCKIHFGKVENAWYSLDRLIESYNEQKAQMSMKTDYTDWGGIDGTE